MKPYQKIIFLLFFVTGITLFAQQNNSKSFKLKWKINTTFVVNKNTEIVTDLVEDNFLNENLIPTYNAIWKVNSGVEAIDFTIKNIVYETISDADKKYKLKFIPSVVTLNFNITNSKNNALAILDLVPLVKIENQVKRVVSFDFEYTTASSKKNSRKNTIVKNSVLASGEWFKFAISKTGVYKLNRKFLQDLGINVNSINPKNIKIYGNGGAMLPLRNSEFRYDDLQENAIIVNGESDASFDNDDFILFYAQGPHTWDYGSNPALNSTLHKFNIFSDESYYFLTIGDSEGKRIFPQESITASSNSTINNFDDFVFLEKDEVNLFSTGQQWFGDGFSIENVRSYKIPFDEIVENEPITVRVRGVVESLQSSLMDVRVNNQNLFSITYGALGGLTRAVANDNSGNINLSGNSVNVEISFNNNGNPGAKAFLDYIEVLGKRKLIAKDQQFSFRNFNILNSSEIVEYTIEGASKIKWIWDISNPLNPKIIKNQSANTNFTFKVNGGQLLEYVLIPEDDFLIPKLLETSVVENQNLHQLQNIDYLIITQDFLSNQAQKLADFHTQNSGLITKVVPVNKIYNEFSSGSPDIAGIRDFVKHLYDNATTNQIKFVCLFGDASYDYKDRIEGNNNIVPVFEAYNSFNLASSFVSDDFYGMMDANEGELNSYERQDVVTGRIPVSDVIQAEQVVSKILDYYNENSFGDWRSKITLIADDIDVRGEEVLQLNMEKIADTISKNKPVYNLKKIYLDAYNQESGASGSRYPTVNLDIINQIDKGTLIVDYFGHGGEDGLASEGIFRLPEIQSLKNKYKLPLFIIVTCEFSRFDNPLRKTAGEFLFWKPNYGAGSLISTTRQIYISVGQAINEQLMKPLLKFDNENLTIAESLMTVKNQFSTTQRYFIYSFGDPAMQLAVPRASIKLKKMNGKNISQSIDTIKALSYVQFEGDIVDSEGNFLNNFNGELDVSVFDKEIIKSTLDNDGKNIVMKFDEINSKIFKGRSKVENGNFKFDFVAPKDIRVAFGKGKLSFYASNKIIDKAGHSFDVTIGGINSNAPEDNTGPVVQLYMNDLNFIDGGTVDNSPNFIVFLEDENGINTSITAVDHDIIAILDNDQNNPIILNDFYQTDLNDYKKGKLNYQFRDLTSGLHTISLKVWDTYNNLTESSFSFFVVDSNDLELSNVLNYPNPFVNYTEFWFNHNKPNEILNVQVQIFTVSGKLVKTINQSVLTDGNLSRNIVWNGLDDFGAKIGKGVYVYKIKVKSINSNTSAQKIEKLVILQ